MPWRSPTAPPLDRQVELLKQKLLQADSDMVALQNNAQVSREVADKTRRELADTQEVIRNAVRRLCTNLPEFQAMQLGGANQFLTLTVPELLTFLVDALEAERRRLKKTIAELERTAARKDQALAEALAQLDDMARDAEAPPASPPHSWTAASSTADSPVDAPSPRGEDIPSPSAASTADPLEVLPSEATAVSRTLRLSEAGDARMAPVKPKPVKSPAPSAVTPAQSLDEALHDMDATLQWFFVHLVTSGYSRYREVLADEAIITKMTQRSIYNRLSELRNLGVISVENTISVTRSRRYQIFTATPLGREVYAQITGEQPPLGLLERLRINHDNAIHGFLIYDTAEILATYGWTCSIDRVVNQITFSDGKTFIPDVFAEKAAIPGEKSQIRMIEVEMGTTRPPDFLEKCDKMYLAVRKSPDPALYFVAKDKPILDSLINHFSEWAVTRKRSGVVGRFATLSMLEEADEWLERQLTSSQ